MIAIHNVLQPLRSSTSRVREVLVPFYVVPVRLYVDPVSSFGLSVWERLDKLQGIHQMCTKVVGAGTLALCGETEVLLSLEVRRLWGGSNSSLPLPMRRPSRWWDSGAWQGDSSHTLKSISVLIYEAVFLPEEQSGIGKGCPERLRCFHP